MVKKVFLLLYVLLFIGAAFGQQDTIKLKKYSPGFRFEEGVYLSHQQLLKNSPIPKQRIITKYNRNDFDFFNKLLMEEKIFYYDKFGLRKEVKTEDLWGFCQRGSIYINWGDDFSRIPVVGSLCHFVASVTTYEDRYYNPMYGYNYYNTTPSTTTKTEIYQFVMDFKTGQVMEYSVENVLVLLMEDPELYDEFNSLSKRKKKQMKFLYIRKFNEKNPLYVPVH